MSGVTVDQIVSNPAAVVLAVVIVDILALLLARNNMVGEVIKDWYNDFSLGAFTSDIASMTFGIFLALVIFKHFLPKSAFTPVNFVVAVVVIQMTHDLSFSLLIRNYKKGQNRMMDMLKRYANENGWKILLVDATMMVTSVVLIYQLLKLDNVWIYMLLAFALYFAQYLIYS